MRATRVVALLAVVTAIPAFAQSSPDSGSRMLVLPVGSANENYLRYAQSLGLVVAGPWSVRPFGSASLDAILDSSARLPYIAAERPAHRAGRLDLQVLPVIGNLWYNTTYPFGWNDGAVWRGRGATTSIEGGIAARWNFLSVTLDPVAFFAENKSFPLMTPVGFTSTVQYVEPMEQDIDRPQRFGPKSYGQLNGGQSTVELHGLGLAGGVSTSNQWIGPMSDWPFLLSNNAAGIPRVFAGSASPWKIGIGKIHGQIFYGGLSQSAFASDPYTMGTGRFISGISGTFSPALLPGLEVGAGRIFEYPWPSDGVGWPDLRKPFGTFLKEHVTTGEGIDNQLASIFARWVLPHSGLEAYGEFGRDDHNVNARDAIVEPDHDATYGLGLRKAWLATDRAVTGIRAEILNMQPSTLARARAQGSWYAHTRTRQGHTQMGQILGAGFVAIEGAGSTIALERFLPTGESESFSLSRMLMRDRATEPSTDVEYAAGFERTRRIGRIRTTVGLTGVYEMNRYFSADVGNVMFTLGARW